MAPFSAPRPCRKYGCPAVTHDAYCPEHKQEAKQQWRSSQEAKRPNARERGYTAAWEKARAAYLKKHLWCVECRKQNRYTIANVVDHIIPHRGDKKLFWDKTNWQQLCKSHHDAKTHKEIGERVRRAI